LAKKIPSWIERLLLPKLSEIGSEIKALNARIDSLEKAIESLRNEMGSLRNEMLARFNAINARIDGLEKSILTREEFAEIKARLAALEKKVPG
jgi:tetrahydromethanopterin S-methyltransferase subunit G